jgi:hypothetical protein
MEWAQRPRKELKTAVYQTGYSQFFDAWTDQCDEISFIPWLPNGPRVKKALRSRLNSLVHQANYVLEYYLSWQNFRFNKDRIGENIAFADWVDFDMVYNDHRFCREGVKEPDRHQKDTWFFHAADGIAKPGPGSKAPEWIVETFHPKSAGHRASKDLLYVKSKFEVFARRLSKKSK